jgi:hypothetical protein
MAHLSATTRPKKQADWWHFPFLGQIFVDRSQVFEVEAASPCSLNTWSLTMNA